MRVCRYCREPKATEAFPLITRGKHKRKDRRRDNRCRDCLNAIPLAALQMIFGGLCCYCGADGDSIDHILPISRGGKHEWANVVLACKACNGDKRNMTPGEWATYGRFRQALSSTERLL